jgi:Flp pilus assembly protein CpaB
VAVKVDEFSSVAGFLKPGSRVDVIAVMSVRRSARRDTVRRTILEDKLVAAVGQEMSDPKDPGANVTRSVTLLVKPQEAAVLHLADTKGTIRLALRQQEDSALGCRGFASQNDLAGDEQDSPPAAQAEPRGWWRDLAAGLASRAAAKARQDARPVVKKPEPVRLAAAPRPWAVTVLNGSDSRTLLFESPNSTRLIGGSGAGSGGILDSKAAMGRYSDVAGREKRRTDGASAEPKWANRPDD